MSGYYWFKLIVRAIGVLLFGLGVTAPIVSIIQIVSYLATSNGVGAPPVSYYLIPQATYGVASLFQPIFGVYLIFGGDWIIQRCLRDAKGRCPNCEYDLTGVDSSLCPECGLATGGRGASAASVPTAKP